MIPPALDIEASGNLMKNRIAAYAKGEGLMDSVHLSCFAPGEVLRVIVPNTLHPQKRI